MQSAAEMETVKSVFSELFSILGNFADAPPSEKSSMNIDGVTFSNVHRLEKRSEERVSGLENCMEDGICSECAQQVSKEPCATETTCQDQEN